MNLPSITQVQVLLDGNIKTLPQVSIFSTKRTLSKREN